MNLSSTFSTGRSRRIFSGLKAHVATALPKMAILKNSVLSVLLLGHLAASHAGIPGLRTTVRLHDDIQCQAYAATADLVGMPRAGRSYRRLVESWLGVYSDARSEIRAIAVGERHGKRVLRFEAVTQDRRVIRGAYLVDARANASIFSTCDHPAASEQARESSEAFFDAIVGSARRFI